MWPDARDVSVMSDSDGLYAGSAYVLMNGMKMLQRRRRHTRHCCQISSRTNFSVYASGSEGFRDRHINTDQKYQYHN